ncbi:Hypothetical protein SCF082_LOCUS2836 [Durusdinium trenchii]|uniref:PDZ domain-containing protein n=1 Tax=Durusdinium trenchii TaxID=1381693 RepID=A0ABP0HP04_9DINO
MVMFLSRIERQALLGIALCVVVIAILHEVTQLKDIAESIQTKILEDHYSTLGLPADATPAEITTGFKRAMTKLTSKQQADQRNRAKINAAHDVLSNSALKAAYDKNRKFVKLTSSVLASACVAVPLLILIRFCSKMASRSNLHPQSFLGQVTTSLQKMEFAVEFQVKAQDSLGAELQMERNGTMLRVRSTISGGSISEHNRKVHDEGCHSAGKGMLWWNAPVLWEGDMLESANGTKGQAAEMLTILKSTESLTLQVRRSWENALVWPWICERRVTKLNSERWGLNLRNARDSSNSLEVTEIVEEGGIAHWNEANPDLAIRVGDRLLAVDQSVGSKDMLAAFADSHSICLLVARGILMPPPTAQASQEVVCGPIFKGEGEKLGIRIGLCVDSPPVHGLLVQPGNLSSIVVKEVVKDLLVDRWNSQQQPSKRLLPGCVVTAVNGCRQKDAFARELSKQQVCISFTPAAHLHAEKEGTSASCAARPIRISVPQDLQPWVVRTFRPWVPNFLWPRPFEEQLRDRLRSLRCEFSLKVRKDDERPIGLQVKQEGEELQVVEVDVEGVVPLSFAESRCPRVESGDWLVGVDDHRVPRLMMEHLSTASGEVELHFARHAAKCAPEVWEIDVEQTQNEGWGLELYTQSGPRNCNHAVLRVRAVGPGAIVTWNEAQEAQWQVQPGDLLVGCEPEARRHQVFLFNLCGAPLTAIYTYCHFACRREPFWHRWRGGAKSECQSDGNPDAQCHGHSQTGRHTQVNPVTPEQNNDH